MFAVEVLSTDATAVLFLVGFALVLLGIGQRSVALLAAGVAVVAFPLCWNAAAVAGW